MSITDKAQSSPKTHEVRLTLNQNVVQVIAIKKPHFKLTKDRYVIQRSNLETPFIRPEKDQPVKRQSAVKAGVVSHRSVTRSFSYSHGSITEYARTLVVERWGESNWYAFYQIVNHESGWNPYAVNRSSKACGLFQALPCSKMGGMGITNQLNWGIGYIAGRYGSPNQAWAFWQAHRWY